jgi:hypothetical protein
MVINSSINIDLSALYVSDELSGEPSYKRERDF